jgi:hypothetical protein
MKRLALSLFASTLMALACSPASRNPPANEPSGGSSGSGGDNASGGQGGSSETGGNDGSGGESSSGGVSGSGGESSSGGNQDTGGSGDSGGSQGSGGSSSAGGSSGNGGAGGGGSNTCGAAPSDNAVAFCKGQAAGAMTGWGWVALGSADTITDPTCDTGKAAITSAAACLTATNWNQSDALCMSGTVPALSDAPTDSEYSSNWGVQIGVNAKDPNAALGDHGYKTITLTVTGAPSTGLRALIHRSGDDDGTSYCAPMTSGSPLTLTSFNNKCWDSSGDDLTDADVPNIDKVSVQVTSTATAITVDKLCLTKVEFGK